MFCQFYRKKKWNYGKINSFLFAKSINSKLKSPK